MSGIIKSPRPPNRAFLVPSVLILNIHIIGTWCCPLYGTICKHKFFSNFAKPFGFAHCFIIVLRYIGVIDRFKFVKILCFAHYQWILIVSDLKLIPVHWWSISIVIRFIVRINIFFSSVIKIWRQSCIWFSSSVEMERSGIIGVWTSDSSGRSGVACGPCKGTDASTLSKNGM